MSGKQRNAYKVATTTRWKQQGRLSVARHFRLSESPHRKRYEGQEIRVTLITWKQRILLCI